MSPESEQDKNPKTLQADGRRVDELDRGSKAKML